MSIGNPTFVVKDKASADRAATGLMNQWKKFTKSVNQNIDPAMNTLAEAIIEETLPMTPKKTGALRASHDFATQIGEESVLLEISFGNKVSGFSRRPDTYAIDAHQRTNVAFRYTEGTRSHWLKIGGHNASQQKGEEIIANELRKSLGL